MFEELARRGGGDRGIHALYLLYRARSVPSYYIVTDPDPDPDADAEADPDV
jgi:hypothetical protein